MKIFNDKPIEVAKKKDIVDTLNTKIYAQAIAEFVATCDTPMTMGIQGDWGSGKTSLLNMISAYLPYKNSMKEILLNTWSYSLFKQDEYLGLSVINALLEKVQEKFDIKKENKLVDGTIRKLRQVINLISKVEVGIPLTPFNIKAEDVKEVFKDETGGKLEFENISKLLEEFKKAFQQIIETKLKDDERLIIYIDDLDRVRPAKAVEVLEALKLYMDIEKCIFILAVDYSVVQLGITQKFGEKIQASSGKSFFDKIIQLPFNMPTYSYELEKYITELLKESELYKYKFESNPKDKEFFVDITEVTVGRNPRSIKRAINYATLLERIRSLYATIDVKKDRDTIKLLYAMVCFQIAWPELFEYFVLNPTPETIKNLEDWDFLKNLPQAKNLLLRLNNPEELLDNISAYFDTLYEILDVQEKDGFIDEEELKPLIEVLKLVKLTSEKNILRSENPLKKFEKKLVENCPKNTELIGFYKDVFTKSYWVTNDKIQYNKAGERYLSITYDRKQIGSISTLKARPFLLRLKISRISLLNNFKQNEEKELFTNLLKNVENPTRGIGDCELDVNYIITFENEKAKEILNILFEKLIETLKI